MLLICKTLVKLELIEDASIKAGIDQSVVLVAFLILLPLEIDEGIGGILFFYPDSASFEYSSNQIFIVSLSQVKLCIK